ncbi:aminopeptidase C [Pisciglobus halotolerans]|uniref:Aminopeptidase n=1 Tax=Pisciglobus halotolerans TaxID=745365 RepID=A0A1I3AM47_9LACT|nr:C1 family peptidase [Pisciglobus halotolerans]SFH51124.1 bleomycin hydrolase [Pisciglobus halotolerans]
MTIDQNLLEQYQARFESHKENQVIEGAIAKVGIKDASLDNNVFRRHSFVFSDETKRGAITNQKASGRCWMFAALNTARVDTMAKLNLETFEFSQNYTLFWDKLEKSNYFLDSILETLEEAIDSRIIAHLLAAPVQDGGQWDMFAGMLEKYGAVPKAVMPETYHSSNTRELNTALTTKLREFASRLRETYQTGATVEDLRAQKEDMLYVIYNILVKALGEVPTTFTYEYRDKDDQFQRIENITPQEFFKEYVGWNLTDRVSLINAPTEDKPYGRAYTVQYLGTVKEAEPIRYINVPMDVLKKAAVASIKNGEPVWYGCDVGQMSVRESGIMDEQSYNYGLTLGEASSLTKAQRLDYGESLLTHAMVLVGVDLDKDGHPINWKVENSWGEKAGKKGIFSMSDKWMDEFAYQISVDKKYIDQEWLKALDEPVIQLAPWDPMGALAMMQ